MDIKAYIKNPKKFIWLADSLGMLKWISDEFYLKIIFRIHMGKRLNLIEPKTFNEKLQWLKIYDRRPEYTNLVDKYNVKKYVAECIGGEYIIPTLGVWDKFEDIDFDTLPERFVLKCTHDSGGLVICQDKSKLDNNAACKKIKKSLKRNYYYGGREWPYKNVKPRIIAEQYMEDSMSKKTQEDILDVQELTDYKIHCFNGEPKLILVCRNRYSKLGMTEDFFTEKWEHLDIKRPGHANSADIIDKPIELEEMLQLSQILAKNYPFVRVDFYIVDHKVYFGELTFYPASGLIRFIPDEYDYILGTWLKTQTDKRM